MEFPPGQAWSRNVEAVAYMDLGGKPGFKMALHRAGARWYFRYSFRSAEIFAGVFLLGALGYIGNAVLERLEAHFLRWRPAVGIA